MKLKRHQVCLLTALIPLTIFGIKSLNVSFTGTEAVPKSATILPLQFSTVETTAVKPPTNTPKPQVKPITQTNSTTVLSKQTINQNSQGGLLVSNRTDHPVRVALLAQTPSQAGYNIPAHWDFAPAEGSINGLNLSLPEGKLKLKLGDILVVFAQDGSREYWGPYVVGKTNSPVWDKQAAQWQLIIQP